MYETLFQSAIKLLPIKLLPIKIELKCLEIIESVWLSIRSSKLFELNTSYLHVIFGGTVKCLAIKWIFLSEQEHLINFLDGSLTTKSMQTPINLIWFSTKRVMLQSALVNLSYKNRRCGKRFGLKIDQVLDFVIMRIFFGRKKVEN